MKEFLLKNKTEIATSLLLFLFMFLFFLYYQEPGFFQHDMAEYAMYAEYMVLDEYDTLYGPYIHSILINGFPWRTGTNYIFTGMFFFAHYFGIDSEQTILLTQFFFGSLAIVFLFLFLKELYDDQTAAVIGALVFGVSAPLFNAVLSKEQGTEFFFAFAAMYLLLVGIKKKNGVLLLAASSSLGFLLWVREIGLLFPIIFFGFFGVQTIFVQNIRTFSVNKETWTLKNIAAITFPFIVLAIIAAYMYLWTIFSHELQNTAAPFFTYIAEIGTSILEWYPFLFFFFLCAGVFFAVQKKEKNALFFAFSILLFVTVFSKNNSFDLRHLGIYVFFPAVILITYAFRALLTRWSGTKKAMVLVLAGILCVQVFLPGISLFEQRKEHIYTKEFVQEAVQEIAKNKNSIILVEKDFCLFFWYYGKISCEGMPANFIATVDHLLASGKKVYVLYHLGFGRYTEDVRAEIETEYILSVVYQGKFETFHHADLDPQVYDEILIEVSQKQ